MRLDLYTSYVAHSVVWPRHESHGNTTYEGRRRASGGRKGVDSEQPLKEQTQLDVCLGA